MSQSRRSPRPALVVVAVGGLVAGVTAVAGVAGPVAAAPDDPSAWSNPQRIATSWAGGSGSGAFGLATTPNGRRAALVMEAAPLGSSQNGVVRAYEWSRGAWRSRGAIPGGGNEAQDLTVQWARSGGRALALWRGQSDEGATDVLASVRDGDRWTAATDVGKGIPTGRIAADGSHALLAWYVEDPEDATTLGLRSSWWADGAWRPATQHVTTGSVLDPLDLRGRPQVAVSADGAAAVLVWSQDGVVRASWCNGSTWSAPLLGPAGVEQQAVALDATATQATVVLTRPVGTAIEFLRVPVSPAGFGALTSMSTVAGSGALGLREVQVNADGSAAMALLANGGEFVPSVVLVWRPGATAPDITNLGPLDAIDIALPAKGPYAFLVMRPASASGALARDRVMAWDGDEWTRIARLRTCGQSHPALAVSARGTTKVLAWSCSPTVWVSRTAGR